MHAKTMTGAFQNKKKVIKTEFFEIKIECRECHSIRAQGSLEWCMEGQIRRIERKTRNAFQTNLWHYILEKFGPEQP